MRRWESSRSRQPRPRRVRRPGPDLSVRRTSTNASLESQALPRVLPTRGARAERGRGPPGRFLGQVSFPREIGVFRPHRANTRDMFGKGSDERVAGSLASGASTALEQRVKNGRGAMTCPRFARAEEHDGARAARTQSMTVLVTGGAGYIGSHAAKALRRAGHQRGDLRQPVGGPPRRRARGAARRGRNRRYRCGAPRHSRVGRHGRHALRRVAERGRLGARPGRCTTATT